jgi:uncharacterized membrane protein YbhN (UPF0104 family)/tRNA A-37 threonylcarbamoyl transferase component Bud32
VLERNDNPPATVPGQPTAMCSDDRVTGALSPNDQTAPVEATPGGPPRTSRRRGRHVAHRWRSVVFAPAGDGSIRRRPSDVVKLVIAAVVLALLVAAIRNDTVASARLVDDVVPPPEGLHWLVSALSFLGSLGTIAALALLALLSRRVRMAIETAAAGLGAWAVCGLLGAVLGTTAGYPAGAAPAGVDPTFPLARLAAAMAVASVTLPYLSRPVRRLFWTMIALGAIASVWRGSGLPADVLASIVIGWAVAAVVHLALGSPAGFPSASEVTEAVDELGVELRSVAAQDRQEWGLARFNAVDDDGRPVEVSIYGRDASDAQLLAKLWRFAWYRDSGPTLTLTRLQQVEHEAYLTLLVGHAGVGVPDVVVVGTSEDSGDAVLVTRPLPGRPLASLGPDDVDDDTLDELFAAVARLRAAGIAHGAINGESVLLADDGTVSIRDLRQASSGASVDRLERDMAATVVTAALAVGPERAVAAAIRSTGTDQMGATLARLQRAGFDKGLRDQLRGHKELLGQLRDAGAAAAGVDVPQLAEVHRVSTSSLLMGLGAVVGVYLIVQEFSGIDDLGATLKSADGWWVGVAFVLAQLTNVAQAVSVLGSVSTPLPFGPTIGLELANAFTGLVAGTVGTTATIIRYFQRRGLAVSVAVSSGVLCSLANMAVQAALFVVAFLISHSSFSYAFNQSSGSGSSSSGSDTTWLLVLLVVGLAAVGAVTLVPRFRHRAVDKLKPQVDAARTNLRELAGQPSKLLRLFGGAALSQLLFALVLGASLHAYGASANLAELIVINTLASLLGGIAPVPGGMGVIEAGLIAGFTAMGIPNTIAVAATLTARLMTCYLPPIWGYPTLVWMRRREYL